MSSTYRIVCTHHEPRIWSDELGPVRVIADVKDLYSQRAELLEAIALLDSLGLDTHNLGVEWQNAVVRFFRQHPTCVLALADEDGGKESPLDQDSAVTDDVVDETRPGGRSK